MPGCFYDYSYPFQILYCINSCSPRASGTTGYCLKTRKTTHILAGKITKSKIYDLHNRFTSPNKVFVWCYEESSFIVLHSIGLLQIKKLGHTPSRAMQPSLFIQSRKLCSLSSCLRTWVTECFIA